MENIRFDPRELHKFEFGGKVGEPDHREPPFVTDFSEVSLLPKMSDEEWMAAKCSFLGGVEKGFVENVST